MSTLISIIAALIGLAILLGLAAAFVFGLYILYKKAMGIYGTGERESSSATSAVKNMASDTLFLRIAAGLLLILASLVPLGFVSELVKERGALYESVAGRMTDEWSGPQQISGPVLSIPYEYTDFVIDKVENRKTGEIRNEKRPITSTRHLLILPDKLEINTDLDAKELSRGIYKVPIYSSKSRLAGSFKWPDLTPLSHAPQKFIWNKAVLVFLVSGAKGIEAGTALNWNGAAADLLPGSGAGVIGPSYEAVHARLNLSEDFQNQPVSFDLALNLRGSRSVSFAPTGKESLVRLQANWGAPSFQGKILPSSREITATNFKAEWNVTHLSRSYEGVQSLIPGASEAFIGQLAGFNFGANLFRPVDLYVLLERTIKYGVMFIALTFFSIFIIEFASGARLHWLQQLIIGAALSMFYLCVLAFSEHIPFGQAYGIGVGLITGIIGCYAWIAMGRFLYGAALGGIMLALYTVLYSILQMEDYALLIGTLLLLVFLVLGMYFTRNMGRRN